MHRCKTVLHLDPTQITNGVTFKNIIKFNKLTNMVVL